MSIQPKSLVDVPGEVFFYDFFTTSECMHLDRLSDQIIAAQQKTNLKLYEIAVRKFTRLECEEEADLSRNDILNLGLNLKSEENDLEKDFFRRLFDKIDSICAKYMLVSDTKIRLLLNTCEVTPHSTVEPTGSFYHKDASEYSLVVALKERKWDGGEFCIAYPESTDKDLTPLYSRALEQGEGVLWNNKPYVHRVNPITSTSNDRCIRKVLLAFITKDSAY